VYFSESKRSQVLLYVHLYLSLFALALLHEATFCLCFYDIALWFSYSVGSLSKFRYCYNKCIKLFLVTISMTVLLTFYLKLIFRALALYVTMPSVLSVHHVCLAATHWCPCCVHLCHVNLCVLMLFCLSFFVVLGF